MKSIYELVFQLCVKPCKISKFERLQLIVHVKMQKLKQNLYYN